MALAVERHEAQNEARDQLRRDDWFEDVTDSSGLRFTYRNGREAGRYYMIESFGGGVACVDFDRDGDIDLYFTGGGSISREKPDDIRGLPGALFRNDGQFRLVEVTRQAGLAAPADYSQGCAVTDFDVDGFPDLFVCCYGRNRLYRNLGDGTYQEVDDRQRFSAADWSTAAAFADIDRDGLPDLTVARYAEWSPQRDVRCVTKGQRDLCGPSSYAATTCRVFHNAGDGGFEDWSEQAGVVGSVHGLGVVAADLNLDGRVDLYVASDITPNQLYLGGSGLPMVECGLPAGVAVNEWGQAEGSMGVDVNDYDGDGRPDVWVANYELEDNALYQNRGDGLFVHATVAAGLAGVCRMRVSFGTSLMDFDGDSRPDLFVLNGSPIYEVAETPFRQIPQLFRNLGGRFQEVTPQGGTFFRTAHAGRGCAAADLDNDGAPDIVVVPMNDPVRVLRNRRLPRNFVRVQLRAVRGEPDATGARATAKYAGRDIVQFATRSNGYFSQPDPRMIFPLDVEQTTVDVIVDWLDRGREVFRELPVRTTCVLVEGRGEAAHE